MLLNTGYFAACGLEQLETALALNAERIEHKRKRDADEVEIARARFNDFGPLASLRRHREARELLEYCRAVFDRANAVYELSGIYTALANMEYREGDPASAKRFEQTALRYIYQIGQPERCAGSHHNLATYIMHAEGGVPDSALAHLLAGAVIHLQTGSGHLASSLRALALSILPPAPPSFAEVCAIVEQIEGVRFQVLFAQLPKRAPDGDTAIQAVWELAEDEAEKMTDRQARIEAVLPNLPEALREAILARDEEKFNAALAKLSPEQQQHVMAVLNAGEGRSEGDAKQEAPSEMQEVLRNSEMFLQVIAAVARGHSEQRAEVEDLLLQFEANGWHIADAVRRIWAGERNAAALTAGLDAQDSALVRRVLEIVRTP